MRKSSINSLIRIKKIPNKKSISTSISLTRPTTQTQNKIVKNENSQNLSLLNSFSKIKIIKKNNSVNLNNNTINIKKNKTNSSLNLTKKIIIPYNSNEYWHLIDPKLHTNKIQLNWNFNLRIYNNNNNNNKKFVRSFSAPSFYEEDLNKYKKKLSNKNNKITDDDKNKNYINIKHLFKNNINGMFQTNNHFNFEVTLRDFKLKKHSNSFVNPKKWKNFDGKKSNKEIVNLVPNKNIKENSILRPFNIINEKILFYNDPIIKKTYLKDKNLAYNFNYNHMNSLPFNDNFNERNYVKLKEIFDKKNNLNEYIFQFGLRNNKIFK